MVPELPDAPILGVPCSDDPTEVRVCLTLDDAVALARWVARVVDIEAALAGCNLVRRVP